MADPVLFELLLNVAAAGLYDAARRFTRLDRTASDRRALVEGQVLSDPAVSNAIGIATEKMTAVEEIDPRLGGESFREFLAGPEVRQIVGELFVTDLAQADLGGEALREQFLASFSIAVGVPASELAEHSSRIFDALTISMLAALRAAIDRDALSAHEATSALRHRLLQGQLDNIEANLSLLAELDRPSVVEILEFEEKYRRQVRKRASHIVPPSLDRNERKPIADLYVAPEFQFPSSTEQQPYLENLSYDQLLRDLHRVVLLGDPGGGKSTLTLKLCHDLAAPRSSDTSQSSSPILVSLRDYGVAKAKDACSLLDFMAREAHASLQITEVPAGAFEYLLRNGRALVIFDGLDELLDTSFRQQVTADVESFAGMFPKVPILVTSRKVGYEQAPLDTSEFPVVLLGEFTSEQVEEYATKWFDLDADLPEPEQEGRVADFMRESEIVPDLRANPLLLGLLCNIYRGESYIPANRPDVFKKCALMLFERWDRRRGIVVPLPFESRLRPTMQYLAHWIYSDAALQAGVTQNDLVDKATEYLHPRRFEHEEDARQAAEDFIDLCKGRAWVFTDTGSTGPGVRLFQFTHRTFLEYFSADYLARTHNGPAALTDILAPRIALREWDVVAQLAIQIQTDYVEDAGDEVINDLLDRGLEASPEERLNLVSFSSRSLEFLVPSPHCIRRITAETLDTALTLVRAGEATTRQDPNDPLVEQSPAEELIRGLTGAGSEAEDTVADELSQFLTRAFKQASGREAVAIGELGLHLSISHRRGRNTDRWRRVSDALADEWRDKLVALAPTEFSTAVDCLTLGFVTIPEFVEWHGVEQLFSERQYVFWSRVRSAPLAYLCVWGATTAFKHEGWKERRKRFEERLGELGDVLSNTDPPWTHHERGTFGSWLYHVGEGRCSLQNPTPEQQFAMFAVLAAASEATDEEVRKEILRRLPSLKPPLAAYAPAIEARFAGSADLKELGNHPPRVQEFIGDWVTGKIDLALAPSVEPLP